MKGDKSDLGSHWKMHEHSDVPLKVAGRSYRRFASWLDGQISRLVARWAHTAAPSTRRSPSFRIRYLKRK
jgi:hypothetical protein